MVLLQIFEIHWRADTNYMHGDNRNKPGSGWEYLVTGYRTVGMLRCLDLQQKYSVSSVSLDKFVRTKNDVPFRSRHLAQQLNVIKSLSVSGLNRTSASNSSFLLICTLGGSRGWLNYFGLCHPHRRWKLTSRILALAGSSPRYWPMFAKSANIQNISMTSH